MLRKPAPKPVIQVVKVREEKRTVTETKSRKYGYSSMSDEVEKVTKDVSFTVVLFVKDGELMTREFNGAWDLQDIKKWEEI